MLTGDLLQPIRWCEPAGHVDVLDFTGIEAGISSAESEGAPRSSIQHTGISDPSL